MIIEYTVPSLALSYRCKKCQIIYASVHSYFLHEKQIPMNLYEMSTYKSCWRWSVSQFSTCMSFWEMVARGIVFLIPRLTSQMHTFLEQMNWLRLLDSDDVKRKTSLFSVPGKSAWYCFMLFALLFLCHLCPVHKINAQTPITAILSTCLLREFIVNVKCRTDWS